jgi:predicted dehydrogenase
MKRRHFVQRASILGASAWVVPQVFSYSGKPADKIVVGVMGTNSRGEYLATLFASQPDIEVGFICDVDSNVLARTIDKVEKVSGKKPKGFRDVRQMLEEKDLDAIAVAAPDHWHAPAALLAVKAGKHVYVEKPCSHNPAEGEMLVEAAVKYNKLIQMGNQRRSWPGVIEAMQALKEGAIGRAYYAKGWYVNSRKSIGTGKAVAVPSHLDYELWQGPAPRTQYKDNVVHYNWHWFWNWGTGEALNNGTHEIDVMRWGLGVDLPSRVTSAGGRYHYKDDWETPDTQVIAFEFPNNKAISWEGKSCNSFDEMNSGRGTIFYGDKGTMLLTGGDDYKIFDPANKLIKEVKSPIGTIVPTATGMGDKLDGLHLVNFADSIRGKTTLASPIADAFKSTLLPQLGNIAQRSGKALDCDPATGKFTNKEAMQYWSRTYEKGWEMKLA